MKNYQSVQKQFKRFDGTLLADLKTAFKTNLTGKRSQHFDDMLVAIVAAMLIKDEKIATLKGQMTKAGVDTAKIAAMVEQFNQKTRPLPF
jgi:hypothetical protein